MAGLCFFFAAGRTTDGVDSKHLQTVLEGLAECPATKQILMITHVPWDKTDLPVTHIERTKNVSEVQAKQRGRSSYELEDRIS